MTAEIGTTLREILAEVTDVEDPALRGSEDDLFAYGLTSLETVRLLLQIETRYGVQIPNELVTQNLFRSLGSLERTVAQLCSGIR